MKIAFYAPMKSPRHPQPSGDRRIARLFERALASAGNYVELASELRSFDGDGNPNRQIEIRRAAELEVDRLVKHWADDPPEAWFSYHLFHKAPDWIGPAVCEALNIPYVVAEASFAPKQSNGAWQLGHEQVHRALSQCAAVITLNPIDLECVRPVLSPSCICIDLPAFVDIDTLFSRANRTLSTIREELGLDSKLTVVSTIAMMRRGDKLDSFTVLAQSLGQIDSAGWQVVIAGDGAAGNEVRGLFENIDAPVSFTGKADPGQVAEILSVSDLFVWPAINEAIGMAMLEAQCLGVPVVAGRYGAVHTVIEHGETGLLTEPGDAAEFGAAVDRLIRQPSMRQEFRERALRRTRDRHSLNGAATVLGNLLDQLA